MKQFFFLMLAGLLASPVSAQVPANDDCGTPIQFGIAPSCTGDVYTTLGATPSNIGLNNKPSCLATDPTFDVWFTFVCPTDILDFRIELSEAGPNPLKNPVITVYRGDCSTDGLAELGCMPTTLGATEVHLDVEGLTPGATYFLRISDNSPSVSPTPGTFGLCVNKIPPVVTIDQGSSTLCEGTIYDSGGPLGDYGTDENFTFTICPNKPSACIDFTLEYYSVDIGFTPSNAGVDLLSFFDGPNVNAPVLGEINGFSTNTSMVGGGGVCFRVQATSGCLTINFQSDDLTNFEGFKGTWKCSDKPCDPIAPLEVETSVVNADIVSAVLAPGTKVTITDVNCEYGAYGTFSHVSDNNDLGLSNGLVLSSGDATNISGTNGFINISTENFRPGDADLDYLSNIQGNSSLSFDACVVEMDVFVASDELKFEYVFGSDEYLEFVNTQYNDIFAFLASGPGIAGDPNLDNAINIATLPNSATPVQINSVNNISNWQYFRNNGIYDGSTLTFDGLTSDYLGVKKSLTARVDVIPCNTYHLKLAVADRGDRSLDSGVFISEIKGGAPTLDVEFASGLDYLIESCSGNLDQLVIELDQPKDVPATYTVTVSGSATQGTDYLLNVPNLITFQPGDSVFVFPLIPLADNEPEGTETILLSISRDFGCGKVVFQVLKILLKDDAEVLVNAGADTLYVCQGGTAQLEATGALSYFWEPPSAVSDFSIPDPTITPSQDLWLKVTGAVGTCVDEDSIFVKVISKPTIDVQSLGAPNICLGDTLQLLAVTNVGTAGFSWSPKTRLSNPDSLVTSAYPLSTTTYTGTVAVAGCLPVSDQVTVTVDSLFFPELIHDTTICQNYSVQLGEKLISSTIYSWSPQDGLDDPNSSGPLATPEQTTTYTLTATSPNGLCSNTATVTITVIPADVDIQGDEYREICLGDTVLLDAFANPPGATVIWSPPFYVTPVTGPNVMTIPDESVTITATYIINGCPVHDSVHIRVDSLPELAIIRQPDKPIYCPGDTVYLISKTYEPANFPDITHKWDSYPGELTPVENWNMVINATLTHTFVRVTTNHACKDSAQVIVPVGVPPTITLTATPPEICPGASSQLEAMVQPLQAVKWEDPTMSLSCTECPKPVATPVVTTTYQMTTPEADCPSGAAITVTVLPLPALSLEDKSICKGQSIVLNNIPTNPDDQYTWTANPPPGNFDDPNIPTPTVTPSVNTIYSVIAKGDCMNQGSVTITVESGSLDAGPDQQVCEGTPVTLSATASSTTAGIVLWNPGGLPGPVLNITPGATATYTAVLSFSPNCILTDDVVVTVYPLPKLNLTPNPDSLCLGESVTLNSIDESPQVTYQWTSNPPGFSSTLATPSDMPNVTTTYRVLAQAQFPQQICTIQADKLVVVSDATIDAGSDQTACPGVPVTLSATVTGTPGQITWVPGNLSGNPVTVTPQDTTTYTALLEFGQDCQETDLLTVNVVPSFKLTDIAANPQKDTLCIGATLRLKTTSNLDDVEYTWLQNGVPIEGETKDSLKVSVAGDAVPVDVIYTVVATDKFNCTVSKSYKQTVKPCFVFPNAFTPNNDNVNDTFGGITYFGDEAAVEIIEFRVFNRWGQQVFEAKGTQTTWDGKVDGKEAPMDVYAYYITIGFGNGNQRTFNGDVTLLR